MVRSAWMGKMLKTHTPSEHNAVFIPADISRPLSGMAV
jgi:hypothetical protein